MTAPAASGSVPAGLRYPVTALVRDEDAGVRSHGATRRLLRLVSEFDAASYAALDVRTTNDPGRLQIALEIHGSAAREVTAADLDAALGECVVLGEPVPCAARQAPLADSAYEVTRIEVTPMFRAPGSDDHSRPEWLATADLSDGPGFAAPLPHDGDSAETLLTALGRTRQAVWVRTVLGPADELTAGIVADELAASMHRQAVADYMRVPLRARTVVLARGVVPVSVRAALRSRGTGIRLSAVDTRQVEDMWSDPVAAISSASIGEAHAAAIARIPTAGTMSPLGVPTVRPAIIERPLDPMPAPPEDPIRLGWATDAFGRPVSVEMDAGDLLRHCFIEGRSGSGKTTTIAQIFRSIVRAGHPVIYLDPHGDGAARAAAYSSERNGPHAYYVRHGDRQHPIRMNPLAESDAEDRERMLTELLELIQVMLDPQREGMVGERFKRTFALIAQAAFELFGPRTSITDVLALSLTKESLRTLAQAVRATAPDAAARLEAELYSLGDKEFADLVSWFVSRLQPFLRTPTLREILGTGADSVDMLDVLESGRSLIVDLASLELGEDVARVLGALWLLKLRSAMGRRSDRSRPVVLLVDEAHLYTFGALPGLLAEARKFGVGVVVATQSADNLTPRLARAIEANCGSAISLRTGIATAQAASDRLGGWPAMHLTRLPDLVAAVSLSRAGVPTPAFTLHVDHFDVVADEGWDNERLRSRAEEVAETSRETLCGPFADYAVLSDAEVLATVREIVRRRVAARDARRQGAERTGPRHAEPTIARQEPRQDRPTGDLLDLWRDATADVTIRTEGGD